MAVVLDKILIRILTSYNVLYLEFLQDFKYITANCFFSDM